MALLAGNQIAQVWSDGQADRVAVFALRNFTTGDTVDLSGWFTKVLSCVLQATTQNIKGLPTVSGSVVTLTPTSLAGDAGFIMVWGCAG